MELCGAVMLFYIKCGEAAHERSFTAILGGKIVVYACSSQYDQISW